MSIGSCSLMVRRLLQAWWTGHTPCAILLIQRLCSALSTHTQPLVAWTRAWQQGGHGYSHHGPSAAEPCRLSSCCDQILPSQSRLRAVARAAPCWASGYVVQPCSDAARMAWGAIWGLGTLRLRRASCWNWTTYGRSAQNFDVSFGDGNIQQGRKSPKSV